MLPRSVAILLVMSSLLALPDRSLGEPPVASYIFPAGVQRGTTCSVRVGGMFFHDGAKLEMFGPGFKDQTTLKETDRIWFETPPMLPPVGQGGDEVPRDFLINVNIPADTPVGSLAWRVWTSQGVTTARTFVIGDLPEVVEEEIPGRPVPTEVVTPVTINGRIYPSEDIDVWRFSARQGEQLLLSVAAAEMGYAVRPRLRVMDSDGKLLATASGTSQRDPHLEFRVPRDGQYEVRVDDIRLEYTNRNQGLRRSAPQSYVYRLTLAPLAQVTGTYPLGGRRGSTIALRLFGYGLTDSPFDIALPNKPGDVWNTRISKPVMTTSPVTLQLSDFDEFVEKERNDTPEQAEIISVPTIINGRIDHGGDVDQFRMVLKGSQAVDFDLWAARLNSPLDAAISIVDRQGRELIRDEALSGEKMDPGFRFVPEKEAEYLVRISSRLTTRGGPSYAYRMHVVPTESDFRLALSGDVVTVFREAPADHPGGSYQTQEGSLAKLVVKLEGPGSLSVPVEISVAGLPDGVTVTGTEIAAGGRQTELAFTALATTTIQSSRLTITGTAELQGGSVSRTARVRRRWNEVPIDHVRLAVAIRTPFQILGVTEYSQTPRGVDNFPWEFRIERNGFEGPVTVQLSDRHYRQLQGMSGSAFVVPAGQERFTYLITVPPWVTTNRTSRSALMGVADVVDHDGSRHPVIYSAENPPNQIFLLITSGPLSIKSHRQTVPAKPGTTVEVPLRIERDVSLTGGVRVTLEVPSHIRGVKAEPLVISADENEATMRLSFSDPLGPLNMPVILRATTLSTSDPLHAETELELVALQP
ncbi:MAG: hypothetical protein CMJ81_03810 [Planctomycetaceae bacterium]|nr:hypothetical protein [Planctomycetaceae bacterium]